MRVISDKKSNYCLALKGYRELPLASLSAGITGMNLDAQLEQVLLIVESFAFGGWGSFKCPPFLHPVWFSCSALRGSIAQEVRSQRPWHGAGIGY